MKFVIFDIDGTLTDTKKVEDKCFMKAFEQTFKIGIWDEKWENLKYVTDWGITEEIVQRVNKRKPSYNEYQLMMSNFIANLNKEKEIDITQFSEVPGARDFFYKLKNMKEIEIGIATGSWEKSAKLKLDNIGIGLDGVCFSNSNFHKSREAITQDGINQLTQQTYDAPDQIIYFGDGEWDYKTCQNLGIDFIGIDLNQSGHLHRLGAKNVFHDYLNKATLINALS